MRAPAARLARPPWLRLPRRTARLRLAALCGGLLLVSGTAMVAATYLLFERATESKRPHLPAIPHAPEIGKLEAPSPLAQALPQLLLAQQQLAQAHAAFSPRSPGARGVLSPRPVSPELARDQQRLTRAQHRLTQAVHQLAAAVHQMTQAGSVQAAQRASDSRRLLVDSGIALAVVGALALLAGWLVAGRMLRPIRTITRAARRISSSSLHERLAIDGPQDELKELGDTLDDLLARLEAAFEAQRRFVAHASHELRTPLTRERALVQVALGDPSTPAAWRATARELLASNREQETLIDALLTLASSERGLDRRERVDLAVVVEAVLRERRRRDGAGPTLHVTTAPAPVDGDPLLLESLVANLVDNALTHNVAGGRVDVSTGSEDGEAVLSVANTGPLIAPGDVDRLFQPFQRLDGRRTHHARGHGLGLSIVGAVAAAHRATVTASPLPAGGLSLSVAFPPPLDGSPRPAADPNCATA
jgi:signal transduction histidine kinase